MKILAIDTSTEACSAALQVDNQTQVKFEIAPQQHSRIILEQCDQLLAEASMSVTQLDVIAFGQGPGSFTGLRIAAGVTQGMAFAADLPVIGISTLAAQAQKISSSYPDSVFFSCIDARMEEIYWGCYKLDKKRIVRLQGQEAVNNASEILYRQTESLIGVGSGWKVYRAELENTLRSSKINQVLPNILPSAEEIALLAADKWQQGEFMKAEQAIPVYLRNNVAKKSTKKILS